MKKNDKFQRTGINISWSTPSNIYYLIAEKQLNLKKITNNNSYQNVLDLNRNFIL